MVTTKVKIKEEDYHKYSNSSKEDLNDFVFNIAVHSGFHPCGYGMYSPCLIDEAGEFFAVWKHWDSCD